MTPRSCYANRGADPAGEREASTRPAPQAHSSLHAANEPKAERFIQTLLREWAYRFTYESSAERKQWLTPYVYFYNYQRAHSALGYNPPVSRLDRNNVLKDNS